MRLGPKEPVRRAPKMGSKMMRKDPPKGEGRMHDGGGYPKAGMRMALGKKMPMKKRGKMC